MTPTIHHGDCLEVLRGLPDASVDAVVTDPPYALSFMGKAWDSHDTPIGFQAWCQLWAIECLRVLKPGGHLLAFGGTRTWHRLACAVEDAGFEVRDSIAWMYGSGFPKSLDVSKAIDKAAGAEREVVGMRDNKGRKSADGWGMLQDAAGDPLTAPATDDARTWQGWGTALKPAFEPIVVARKPLTGTVAGNVLAHGTGALNIDGCRVGTPQDKRAAGSRRYIAGGKEPGAVGGAIVAAPHDGLGRWPANVILDEDQANALDQQSGIQKDGVAVNRNSDPAARKPSTVYGAYLNGSREDHGFGGSGGASRFFYVAREDQPCPNPSLASTAEETSSPPSAPADSARGDAATSGRHATEKQTDSPSTNATPSASRPSDETDTPQTPPTADGSSPASQLAKPSPRVSRARCAPSLLPTDTTTTTPSPSTSAGSADPATSSTMPTSRAPGALDSVDARFKYVAKAPKKERPVVDGTAHPTVKPIALMRWLVRLVTPPGGTVLEPFAGSGTTVEACILEGFNVIAIEREADYLPLIQSRIFRAQAAVAVEPEPDLFSEIDGGAA